MIMRYKREDGASNDKLVRIRSVMCEDTAVQKEFDQSYVKTHCVQR